MKPRLLEEPPTTATGCYELKFDGIRLIAIKNGREGQLDSAK